MTPCRQLQFGGIQPGKLLFIPVAFCGGDGCPFAAQSFDPVERELCEKPVHELDQITQTLFEAFAPAQKQQFPLAALINNYTERSERIEYLRRVWMNHAAIVLQISHDYWRDNKLSAFLQQNV